MGVYERLGVRPIINARGMNTMASGSLMARPVLEAMAEAATAFVDMTELNRKAGQHIASLVGVEAAHVTSGSAGGLLLSAAACLAGDDPAAIVQLPDTTGLRNEIVIMACQRIRYDQALRTAGARLVEAGDTERCTSAQLEAAIGNRTAALIFIVSPRLGEEGVSVDEMIRIGHAHGLPVIVDAASTLPPTGHLTRWTSRGADLVIYSGGKGIRGPQGSGLVVGRADLIRAVAANGAPNGAIGRPCKVSKEDIIGLVAALELFLQDDHTGEWDRHLAEAREIVDALEGMPGVEATIEDDREIWTAPTILIALDEARTGLTPEGVVDALHDGDPPIMTRVFRDRLLVDPHCLLPGEAAIVTRRLREELAPVAVGA
ncbi:MAG: aminotransferase class V-fold PLP-dependent enzyme [Chloroflexi bacterium]|nr:aminotransferase class V-fold PLP-dependent enzyme [Chloroflexota bacterium]